MWGDTLVPCNDIYKHRDQRLGTNTVTQCAEGDCCHLLQLYFWSNSPPPEPQTYADDYLKIGQGGNGIGGKICLFFGCNIVLHIPNAPLTWQKATFTSLFQETEKLLPLPSFPHSPIHNEPTNITCFWGCLDATVECYPSSIQCLVGLYFIMFHLQFRMICLLKCP